jgi:hypothetical protein
MPQVAGSGTPATKVDPPTIPVIVCVPTRLDMSAANNTDGEPPLLRARFARDSPSTVNASELPPVAALSIEYWKFPNSSSWFPVVVTTENPALRPVMTLAGVPGLLENPKLNASSPVPALQRACHRSFFEILRA